jgi:hypothetical protein
MDTQEAVQLPFGNFTIDPVTNWQRFFNPQFVINYNTGDVGIENKVLQQSGSYGKQLGKVFDVLDVLIAHIPTEDLTPQERSALDDFRKLQDRVERAKGQIRKPRKRDITGDDVDQLIGGLQSLAHSDQSAYRQIRDRLLSGLGADTA